MLALGMAKNAYKLLLVYKLETGSKKISSKN